MGRGPLRLRSSSAHRRGFLHLGYFREMSFVALLMGAILTVQQSLRSPAAPASDNPHKEQPVYGLGFAEAGKTLWIARERYGISHISLADGIETDRWMLFQSEASFVAEGGLDSITTIRLGMDHQVDLMRDGQTIHTESLPKWFSAISDTDIAHDGHIAVAVSNTGHMAVWTMGNSTRNITSKVYAIPNQMDHVSISRDGTMMALVNWESVTLWNCEQEKIVQSWSVSHGAKSTKYSNRADALAWSPDGSRLALAFDDGIVRVWDTNDRKLVWEHQADEYKASAVAFDGTGTKLATGGFDKQVRVWDLDSSTLLWQHAYHTKSIHNLVFAERDDRLYSGGLDGKVCEWDVTTGTPVRNLP